MAILHVFADESSDKRQQGLLTVGGFMGLPESFSEAEKQWTALLKSKGISYFRAYEAELLDGQFGSLRLQLEASPLAFTCPASIRSWTSIQTPPLVLGPPTLRFGRADASSRSALNE
jgi:hypothetical protein